MTDPMRLSHSQTGSLNGCSLSWWLQRRGRMPQVSYWSTIAGSTFHERLEHYLLNDRTWPEESIQDHVQRLVDKHLENSPFTEETGLRVSKALPSGLKPGNHPHGFDKAAVVAVMPLWQAKAVKWLDAQAEAGWHVWEYPDDGTSSLLIGMPGVEVEVKYELGGHPVIGSIDLVLEHDDGSLALWDWKAGRSKPDDTSQLDGYRIGFEATYGIKPDLAGFWMVRTGKEHLTASLPTFSKSMLDYKFKSAGMRADMAEAGHFELDMTKCQYMCSVETWCPARHPEIEEAGIVVLPLPMMRDGA